MKKRYLLLSLFSLLLISCQESSGSSINESSSQGVQGELIESQNSLEFNPFESNSSLETSVSSSEKTSQEIQGDARFQAILGTYQGLDIASSEFTFVISSDAITLTNVYEDNSSLSLIRKESANPAINHNHTESNGYFTFVASEDEECIIEFWDNNKNYSLEVLSDPQETIMNETFLYLEEQQIELTKAA